MNEKINLEQIMAEICPADTLAAAEAKNRWNAIAKPLHGLGTLEDAVVKIAGMTGNADVMLNKKALLVLCADHGVVEEGVTQTGQAVTAIVAENILKQQSSVAWMCKTAGIDIFPVDIGMAADTALLNCKIAYGTKNMCKAPAMTRAQALQAIQTGIRLAYDIHQKGYSILLLGEMGIGNTTASSAVASVLLNEAPKTMTGRGAGLSDAGYRRKCQAIEAAIAVNKPDAGDVLDVLSKVGGFEIAGLMGACLGGAYFKMPVLLDGFISAVAALSAVRLCPQVKDYLLASHTSKEQGMVRILEELGLEASLHCRMCLGEGTGAAAFVPLLEMALAVYQNMGTFKDHAIEPYKDLEGM